MKKLLFLLFSFSIATIYAQKDNFDEQLKKMTQQIDSLVSIKNIDLQKDIDSINILVKNNHFSSGEAELIKKELVKQYADEVDFLIFKYTYNLKKWAKDREVVKQVKYDKEQKSIQYTIRVIEQNTKKKHEKHSFNRSYDSWYLAAGFNNIIDNKQINSLNESPYGLWQSRFLAFGFTHKTALAKKSRFAYFTYGANITWNTLKPDGDKYHKMVNDTMQIVDFGQELSTSKLRNVWLKVPVGLEFHLHTSKYNHIKLALGVYGKMRIKTKQKLAYSVDDIDNETVQKGQFNVQNFNYGLNAEIGENNWSIYVNYDLDNLFKHHNWQQISFGLKWEM